MSKIPLAHLPGIGYQTIDKLKQAFGEVTTCGDLLGRSLKGKEKNSDIKEIHIHESSDDNEVVNYNQDYKPIVSKLQKCLGAKTGLILYNYLIGLDSSKISDSISISLNEDNLKKSISVEINWGVRFESMTQVKIFLNALNSELVERMKEEGTKGVVGSKLTFHLRTRHVDAPFDPAKFLGCGHCDKTSK